MIYEIIAPPFSLQFRELPKKELKAYFQWFLEVLPERLDILILAVKSTKGFEHWISDYSNESLNDLGEWFVQHVETRKRTHNEMMEIKNNLSFPIDVPDNELTNRTFSLAFDVSMYVSQVFLKNYPELKWSQEFGSKNNADYGQPVLGGFGSRLFNPVRMLVTFSYGAADKENLGKDLRELYEVWRSMIK